jgi:predicted metal-dependent hydrolase
MEEILLGEITISVTQKDIKHLHLSVYPPNGAVRIAAPHHFELDTIRVYALSKLDWIRKQQTKIRGQLRETPREFLTRESHYYMGKRYLLKIVEVDAAPRVELQHSTLVLYVRVGSSTEKRLEVLNAWYRAQLKALVPGLIAKWEKEFEVSVADYGIKRMKTKWGTCNIGARRIWLNLELAKKPLACLDYIVAHEVLHLLERRHNNRFVGLLDAHLPEWRGVKAELNGLAVSGY